MKLPNCTTHHICECRQAMIDQRDALIKELVEALEYCSAWPPNHNYLPVIKKALKRAKEVMGDDA